jgi:hypothetical protein
VFGIAVLMPDWESGISLDENARLKYQMTRQMESKTDPAMKKSLPLETR